MFFFPFCKVCSSSKFPSLCAPRRVTAHYVSWRATRCPRYPLSGLHVTSDSTHPSESWFFFTHLLHVNDVTGIYFLFSFFVFPLRSVSVVIFFVFHFFFFYLLYVWNFFDNFYMKMILKNYTKTCDYKLHDKFVRTKVVWEIFQITSSYNLCWKVILYKLF